MLAGALAVALVTAWVDGTARPMVMGIMVSAAVTLVLTRWTLGREPLAAVEDAGTAVT